jgi:serine/threonine-protein kinase
MDAGEMGPVPEDQAAGVDALGEGLTAQGQAMGTPAYMAPEQARGQLELIDHRTDVYGLGAILYEVLTGRPPFVAADVSEVLRQVREDPPVPPSRVRAAVPARLEASCMRALSKRPADRHPAAVELAQEVQHWLAESAERKHADEQRARFFALSLDLLAIAGFDGYFKQLNPAWETTLGWTTEELLARPWVEFIHPDDVAPTLAAAEGIMAGNLLINHENRYRCRDGSYKWLLWNAREIVGERLIYAVARDITERKRTEEQLRRAEAELARLRRLPAEQRAAGPA